jgi:hypothetical protein
MEATPELFVEPDPLAFVRPVAYGIWLAVAAMAGRAVAINWRPWWHVVVATVPIACAVRFLRYALFGDTLLNGLNFAVEVASLTIVALAAFRLTRVAQMVGSYGWINERAGAFRWRRRNVSAPTGPTESG